MMVYKFFTMAEKRWRRLDGGGENGLGSDALAEAADVTLDAAVKEEGGPLGLAPRASVAAEVTVLSALGAVLQARGRFDREDYAARHPAGALGSRARRG